MKITPFKRTMAGIIALGMIMSAASCSASGDNNNNGSASADKVSKKVVNSYRSVDIVSDVQLNYIEKVDNIADTGKYLVTGYGDNGSAMYITDSSFETLTEIELNKDKGENTESSTYSGVSKDGTIFVIASNVDYGDFKLPDWDDPNFDYENFDFEAMEKAAKHSYSVYTLDSEGKLISENELQGIDKYADEDQQVYFSAVFPIDADKALVGFDGAVTSYAIVNKDGKIEQDVTLDDPIWSTGSCINKDGNITYTVWDEGNSVVKTFDLATLKNTDKTVPLKDTDVTNIRTMCCGTGDYDFYLSSQTGLYGLKPDGSVDEIINWIDSDINGDFVTTVVPVENDEFIVYTQDWNTGAGNFSRLTRRDPSELESAKVLSLGMMYVHPDISSKVTAFNKSQDDVRIKIVDYSKYDDYDEENKKVINSSENQLKMDIVSGNAPDMVFVYDPGVIKSIASKGVFADLYPLLGTNGSAKKEDIMDNVLKACEYDGKLVTITPGFSVSTIAAKTKLLDGKTSWNLDELIDAYHKLPKGTKLFGSMMGGREDILNMLSISNKSLIDTEKHTCNFNSPEVVKLLNFCNEFEEEEEFDWEHASQSEMQEYYEKEETSYRDDKAFLMQYDLSDLAGYKELSQGSFGDDVTLIGFPTGSGNGALISCYTCFSILNSASDKDACWKFISQFLTPEYQSSEENRMMGTIPSLKSSFEEALDAATKKPFYTDADGKKVEYDRTYYIGNKEIKIDPLNEEEKNFIRDYILASDETGVGYTDSEIENIFMEETKAFFNGERTAEETAELLQNRISIILSEQS